jgi:predicted NAD/FAD-dependent oxidoreductase
MADVAVIGGGISGIACATALADAGLSVDVFDRGHRLGGRLATQTLRDTGTPYDGRVVDVGASYFTVDDPGFGTVVGDWIDRGLVRPWTDTFHIADGSTVLGTKTGPMRYAAPRGLRSLVEDLATVLPSDLVEIRHPIDVTDIEVRDDGVRVIDRDYRAVALCGPDPQMDALVAGADAPLWEPVLALLSVYADRAWDFDGAFVNDDPVLSFVADDGSRRGDDAPVLVAHSTPVLAAGHLAEPVTAAPAMLAVLGNLTSGAAPEWFTVKRWTYARPAHARPEPFALDGVVGRAGDGWNGDPRTQSAWVSGDALGQAMGELFG